MRWGGAYIFQNLPFIFLHACACTTFNSEHNDVSKIAWINVRLGMKQ